MPGGRCCWRAGSTGSRCRSRPRTWISSRPRAAAAREIALAFGVPPLLLGLPGDNTYANYAEANRAFYRQTVIPLVRRTAEALAHWLEPAFGAARLEPDLDAIEALAPERESLWRRVQAADFLTEARSARRWATGRAEVGRSADPSRGSCVSGPVRTRRIRSDRRRQPHLRRLGAADERHRVGRNVPVLGDEDGAIGLRLGDEQVIPRIPVLPGKVAEGRQMRRGDPDAVEPWSRTASRMLPRSALSCPTRTFPWISQRDATETRDVVGGVRDQVLGGPAESRVCEQPPEQGVGVEAEASRLLATPPHPALASDHRPPHPVHGGQQLRGGHQIRCLRRSARAGCQAGADLTAWAAERSRSPRARSHREGSRHGAPAA